MAFVQGRGVVVSVDAKDLSVYGTSCEYELKADALDVTTFGQDNKVFSGGLKESSMKIEGNYDDTATSGPRAVLEDLVGTVTEMVYKPEGATGPVRTWDCLCTTYNESSKVDDMVRFTANFQGSGSIAVTP